MLDSMCIGWQSCSRTNKLALDAPGSALLRFSGSLVPQLLRHRCCTWGLPHALQDWKLFLVQEFCEGGSLRHAIDRCIFITPDCKTKLVRAAHATDLAQAFWTRAHAWAA